MISACAKALSQPTGKAFALFLTDNGFGNPNENGNGKRLGDLVIESGQVPDEAERRLLFEVLSAYSGKRVSEFEQRGAELFPGSFCRLNRGLIESADDAPVFSIVGGDYESAYLETGNCMGVVKIRDADRNIEVQLSIGSRFDQSSRQYFINHLLSRVIGGSFVSEVDSGPDSYWEMLLAFLFRKRLLEASRAGLFRCYQKICHDDLRFRGKLDIDLHIRRNIPFIGRLAYTNNEITFDNPLNHLVRHAIRRVTEKWPYFFIGEKPLTDFYHELERNTPSWQKRKAIACIAENQRPVKHPYFHSIYEPIRKLALRILRNEGITPYSGTDEVEGIIFDGAWLWEQYLWTLLRPLGYEHPDNKAKSGQWRVLGETFYPDFFLSKEGQFKVVLDAKYKRGRREQRDILQVAGYMQLLGAGIGGLIKPIGDTSSESFSWGRVPLHDSVWHDISLGVPPNASSSGQFVSEIRKSEQYLTHYIRTMQGAEKVARGVINSL